jgi:hypothetical protein
MNYTNKLSLTTLLGLPAIYTGIVLGSLSTVAVCTGDIDLIPILALISSLIVIISSLALFMKKRWSLNSLSIGLHSFLGMFVLGSFLNNDETTFDRITTFAVVVIPIFLLILCTQNQNVRNELIK